MLSKGIIMIGVGILGIIVSLIILLRLLLKGEKKTEVNFESISDTTKFMGTEKISDVDTSLLSEQSTQKSPTGDVVDKKNKPAATIVISDEPQKKAAKSTILFEEETMQPTVLFSEEDKKTELKSTVLFEQDTKEKGLDPILYFEKEEGLNPSDGSILPTEVFSEKVLGVQATVLYEEDNSKRKVEPTLYFENAGDKEGKTKPAETKVISK